MLALGTGAYVVLHCKACRRVIAGVVNGTPQILLCSRCRERVRVTLEWLGPDKPKDEQPERTPGES